MEARIKIFIIFLLTIFSCKENNDEQCIYYTEQVRKQKSLISDYRNDPDKDWYILADMRLELDKLEEQKNHYCK